MRGSTVHTYLAAVTLLAGFLSATGRIPVHVVRCQVKVQCSPMQEVVYI